MVSFRLYGSYVLQWTRASSSLYLNVHLNAFDEEPGLRGGYPRGCSARAHPGGALFLMSEVPLLSRPNGRERVEHAGGHSTSALSQLIFSPRRFFFELSTNAGIVHVQAPNRNDSSGIFWGLGDGVPHIPGRSLLQTAVLQGYLAHKKHPSP